MTNDHSALPRRAAALLETSSVLDPLVRLVRRAGDAVVSRPAWRSALRGVPLGHAAHPLLTDAPIGLWLSSNALDLTGPRSARAADILLGLGILAAAPAAVTGLADWQSADQRVQRVGAAHAALNVAASTLYAASWVSRRAGRRGVGIATSLAATAVVGASAYLGGHMTLVLDAPPGGIAGAAPRPSSTSTSPTQRTTLEDVTDV